MPDETKCGPFSAKQVKTLNDWTRTDPALRADFLYTDNVPTASRPGFGNLLCRLNSYTIAVRVTSDYTITDDDTVILASSDSGNITVTLPEVTNNRYLWVKKITTSTNTITIQPQGSALVDLNTCLIISSSDLQSYTLYADGSNWWII